MRILHLVLKNQWYQMIESGIKKEEYREIKPYWQSRFMNCYQNNSYCMSGNRCLSSGFINANFGNSCFNVHHLSLKKFDAVCSQRT